MLYLLKQEVVVIKVTVRVVEPVRKSDGTWDVISYDKEQEYPDEAVRDDILCTACGFPDYPECMDFCQHGQSLEKDEK